MEPSVQILLTAVGAYHIALAVFHTLFWRLFDWKTELPRLSPTNRGVVQVMNLGLIALFLIIAGLCLFCAEEMAATCLGRTLLVCLGVFWFARAGLQVIFWGLRKAVSVVLFILFLLGATLCFLAAS
jgi:hypothetical protein